VISIHAAPVASTGPEHERSTAGKWPSISVLVPVRNEAMFIGRTLAQILGQNYPAERFEVLVADGRSDDATRDIVQTWQEAHHQVRLLDNPRQLSSAGRNAALRASRGEIIVVIDGHCELDNPNYLRDLADAFERSGAECVGRPQPLDVSNATTVQKAIALARASRLGHHPDSHIYSGREGFVPPQSVAVAYRRTVFNAVGLFDESFDACEDVEFNHRLDRAGFRCFFSPKVAVRYFPRSSLGGLFRQMVRYGRGRVRLVRKHPDTFRLAGFLPALFLIGLMAGPLLGLLAPWMFSVYLAAVGLYGAILGLASVILSVRTGLPRLLPWLPLVFAAIHGGAGAGILLEWLSGPVARIRAQGIVLLHALAGLLNRRSRAKAMR
jgi:succinoglycan biosynthesis protein ExoA